MICALRLFFRCGVVFTVVGMLVARVHAAQILVPDYELQPNAPMQVIEIPIAGGESISGLDLFVQVGDGGPELELIGLPRGTSGPRITHVELIQGTIFEGVEDLPTDIGSPNLTQTAFYTLALVGSVPKVPANGTLVRLTLDSTGLFHGQWDLKLSDVLPYGEYGGPYSTNLAGIAAEIHNGSLVIPVSMGDFNNNTLLDVNDIDALSQEIRSQQHTATFDLTDDGLVNIDDLLTWVETIKRTHVGDSNLDGEFGSGDLVQVFQAGEYEDGVAGNSSWSTGDWDADSQFGTGDLVLAFQRGGFELGPKATAVQVPEPSALSGLVIGCLFFFLKRRSAGA